MESGSVTVGLSGIPMHGIAPSYAHQVCIDRVVETVAEEESLDTSTKEGLSQGDYVEQTYKKSVYL